MRDTYILKYKFAVFPGDPSTCGLNIVFKLFFSVVAGLILPLTFNMFVCRNQLVACCCLNSGLDYYVKISRSATTFRLFLETFTYQGDVRTYSREKKLCFV